MGIKEKSENFNSLRPMLFELKKLQGVKLPPPPAGISRGVRGEGAAAPPLRVPRPLKGAPI